MQDGERQVAPTLSGIRRDHVARYEWAAQQIGKRKRIVDLACGIGYGAFVLAKSGHRVLAADNDRDALAYGTAHYRHNGVRRLQCDASAFLPAKGTKFDAAVCFETIEHIADPLPMLKALRCAPVLLASVPNEEQFPYRGQKFHHRHYTKKQFESLLAAAGWRVTQWWGQEGPESEVARDVDGRTLVVKAVRAKPNPAAWTLPPPAATCVRNDGASVGPGHVVILGLGPSVENYLDLVKRLGGRKRLADQVWAINALGDVLQCDLIFHMDDVKIQEIRAAAVPDSNISEMVAWMKTHPGPIMTSRAYREYPGLMEFPLEDVINSLGYCYFNNTAAYAVAYAIYRGARKISLFGVDYSYAKSHDAEKGRACVEFWLGIAAARGIELAMSDRSSLMDACEPDDTRIYGYGRFGTRDVTIRQMSGGGARVDFTIREKLPTAAEIEEAYDHSKPTTPKHLLERTQP